MSAETRACFPNSYKNTRWVSSSLGSLSSENLSFSFCGLGEHPGAYPYRNYKALSFPFTIIPLPPLPSPPLQIMKERSLQMYHSELPEGRCRVWTEPSDTWGTNIGRTCWNTRHEGRERGAKGESQCQCSAPGWVEAVGSRRQSLGKGVVVQNEHIMGRCIYGHREETDCTGLKLRKGARSRGRIKGPGAHRRRVHQACPQDANCSPGRKPLDRRGDRNPEALGLQHLGRLWFQVGTCAPNMQRKASGPFQRQNVTTEAELWQVCLPGSPAVGAQDHRDLGQAQKNVPVWDTFSDMGLFLEILFNEQHAK